MWHGRSAEIAGGDGGGQMTRENEPSLEALKRERDPICARWELEPNDAQREAEAYERSLEIRLKLIRGDAND